MIFYHSLEKSATSHLVSLERRLKHSHKRYLERRNTSMDGVSITVLILFQ